MKKLYIMTNVSDFISKSLTRKFNPRDSSLVSVCVEKCVLIRNARVSPAIVVVAATLTLAYVTPRFIEWRIVKKSRVSEAVGSARWHHPRGSPSAASRSRVFRSEVVLFCRRLGPHVLGLFETGPGRMER